MHAEDTQEVSAHDDERFPYDNRPVHPAPPEEHPLETLAGRGQTELTPMGLGGLAWVFLAILGVMLLIIVGGYLLSFAR